MHEADRGWCPLLTGSDMSVLGWIAEALFPRFCVRCNKEGRDVCEGCLGETLQSPLPLSCVVCDAPTPIGATCSGCSSSLDGVVSSFAYSDAVVKGLLKRWKFEYSVSARDALRPLVESTELGELLGAGEWTVVPVPVHCSRLRERGFDQATWIAYVVGEEIGQSAVGLLERVHATLQQARRAGEERRREDLMGSFRARQPIDGRVLLCDDVCTSGATLEAAAAACKEAGATHVWAYTIARG